jgi:hypothetical protein
MTAIDGSRVAAFLSPGTLSEFVADPNLPDWNSNQNYWYGLGIFVGPTPQTWYHGGAIAGASTRLERDGNGYTWAIMTNSLTRDPSAIGNDVDTAMIQALGSGLTGSPTDLYPEYVSPDLPARHQ